MKLDKGVPIEMGTIKGFIFGGPYREYEPWTRRLKGVKMAKEIAHHHDISIPTDDFSVPSGVDMENGMHKAILAIHEGNDLYAGCWGGIGRTGLFMGCMLKVQKDYYHLSYDPVKMVREKYKGHAIETEEQMAFVRNFDTTRLVALAKDLQHIRTVYIDVEKVTVIEKEFSIREWIKNKVKLIALKA